MRPDLLIDMGMGIKNLNLMGIGIEIINGDGESKILPKFDLLPSLMGIH